MLIEGAPGLQFYSLAYDQQNVLKETLKGNIIALLSESCLMVSFYH